MLVKVVLFGLLGVSIHFIFNTLLTLDINKRVYNHRPGECRKIEGPVHGSEDIEVIDKLQIAFISSGLVYLPNSASDVKWKGQIFLYDLTKRSYKAEPIPVLNLEDVDGFHPHGLSHWILNNRTVRLFVVVHSKTFKHSIVILDYNSAKRELNHVKTIRGEKFVRPNDIVATGENSFLVSNDGGAQTALGNVWEILSGFYKGGLVYYNGKKSQFLMENNIANGIILSRDQKTLFVSHINQETIGVYTWNQKDGEIQKISEIETLTGCDNFYVDTQDHLWAGCHPVVKDAAGHLGNVSDSTLYGPSQVLRVSFSKDLKTAEIVEVLADDGRFVSASTIAIPFDDGKQMIVGTVARPAIHCDINVSLNLY